MDAKYSLPNRWKTVKSPVGMKYYRQFFEVRNLYIKKMEVSDLLGLCEPICKLIDAVSKYIFVSGTFM